MRHSEGTEISRTIAMNETAWQQLADLAVVFGVSRSEVLRRLIYKAADDERKTIRAIRAAQENRTD